MLPDTGLNRYRLVNSFMKSKPELVDRLRKKSTKLRLPTIGTSPPSPPLSQRPDLEPWAGRLLDVQG